MKKDYIAIPAESSAVGEREFVEDFWTRRWDGVKSLPDAQFVPGTEEYRIMHPILKTLPSGSKILDGGCGMGAWTVFLTGQGFEVVGLDISQRTVAHLKQILPDYRFMHGDIRATGFPDSSFDAYFSWGTFEHFEEGMGKCFQEARRILKPGAYLFISVPFQNGRHLRRDRRELWKWDDHHDRENGYTCGMRFYQWRLTKPELRREFEINGFKALKIEAIHKWHGLYRAVKQDLHIEAGSTLHRIVQAILYPVVPKQYVAHMLIGVGQRR